MNEQLSPKQVAQAIGVSEASLKRWCDKGLIQSQRTAGGHRRITIPAVLRFLRDEQRPLVRPDLLGLPSNTGAGELTIRRAAETMRRALLTGDEQRVIRIGVDLFLSGQRLVEIFDQTIKPAFESIGDAWQCGEAEVYEERRACELCLRLLHRYSGFLPPPPPEAAPALGAAICGDPYVLPTLMAELTLRELGWHAVSVGSNVPAQSLCKAIASRGPRLVWVSVSWARDDEELLRECRLIWEAAATRNIPVVIGGNHLSEPLRRQMEYTAFGEGMKDLRNFARSIWAATDARRGEQLAERAPQG